jgi:FAD/FMN-containing dehydrogenase
MTPTHSPAVTSARPTVMAQFGHGGAHPNHVSEVAGDRLCAFYGDATYARLVAVKDRWDPRNVFAANQNIRPSVGAGGAAGA